MGLPELTDLNMYGNKVAAVIIPQDQAVLSKLEILNLGYNDLAYIPEELDQLKNLKSLKLMNNFLEKVPMRVCEMDLKTIDVTFNPVIQPPLETCERGIFSMRRYYHCLRLEEQSKNKAIEDAQRKAGRQKKKDQKDVSKKKAYEGFLQKFSISKSPSQTSRHSDGSGHGRGLAIAASTSLISAQSKMAEIDTPMAPLRDIAIDSRKSDSAMASFDDAVESVASATKDFEEVLDPGKTVNDTLKVIFVGMAMVGKTSMIKRLIEGRDAVIPTHIERTVGVDIYSWDPKKDSRFEHIDSRIELQDKELAETCGDVDVKFSCFDFAGKYAVLVKSFSSDMPLNLYESQGSMFIMLHTSCSFPLGHFMFLSGTWGQRTGQHTRENPAWRTRRVLSNCRTIQNQKTKKMVTISRTRKKPGEQTGL